MMPELELALTYGGFTSLDKVYLQTLLAEMTPEERQRWLTPPPSVINAYFAELYQKQSPQAATAYYLELSQAFRLFSSNPSFSKETYPFVRLNLSGQSYGFCYENADEIAQVFGEEDYPVTEETLLALAQIFPHYQIFQDGKRLKMSPLPVDDVMWTEISLSEYLLTKLEISGDLVRISSYNVDEAISVAKTYQGKAFYNYQQRQLVITIKLDNG